jgi:AcrR family transcriptional regulator
MRARDENKENALREKAVEMIVREGLEGFGVNKLARAAGVSPGTIYLYYKSKEDLILTLCLEVSDEILKSSLKNFHPEMSFADGLKLQWKNRYQFFKTDPLKVQFIEQVRYSPIYNKVTHALTESYGEALGSFITRAVERNELIKLPFEVYWSLAFAPLYQLIKFHTQFSDNGRKSVKGIDPQISEMFDIVLKGLKP